MLTDTSKALHIYTIRVLARKCNNNCELNARFNLRNMPSKEKRRLTGINDQNQFMNTCPTLVE